ncbi:MAG: helix-turn-helix transcriptional regulator [Chloroflexi bacterium]|nr:helix-turn-helix transcriptional regulator [Chloroflexota bacterium]
MKITSFEKKASKLLAVMGNPFRLAILLEIGNGEACVCHLEAALNQRQAYISQHLMALRDAGVLKTRREGKYIYYRLSSPQILDLIRQAATIAGIKTDQFPVSAEPAVLKKCACPHCEEEKGMSGIQIATPNSVI